MDKKALGTHNQLVLLLRFRVENHRSLRDEVELSLIPSRHKGAMPGSGDWGTSSLRVAGIYGANASGKSTIIHALGYFRDAIKNSATVWSGGQLPYMPFALDEQSKNQPSVYAADFVVDNVRYEYGFSTRKGRVGMEYLYSFPEGRTRLLFERSDHHDGGYKFGPKFKGGSAAIVRATRATELFLSRAAATQHPVLTELHSALVDGLVVTRFDDMDRSSRISQISAGLLAGDIEFDDIITLLRMADVGIANVEVSTREMDDDLKELMKLIFENARKRVKADLEGDRAEIEDDELGQSNKRSVEVKLSLDETLQRNLEFYHVGVDGANYVLAQNVQSTGTMSWLGLAVPALECLRKGRVLLVDEIDASLHPQLGLALIQMFRDPRINTNNAQLIFTTHDTYYLSPTSITPLADDEVWFAEKSNGATELYSLADFGTRKNENVARKYLSGRYGAIPAVIPSLIAPLIKRSKVEDGPHLDRSQEEIINW